MTERPHTDAVYRVHHSESLSRLHPVLAQSPGEGPREASKTLQGMLGHLGHPDANYAFVMRHPKPEHDRSTPVYSDGDPGVALHPQHWTNEYLAHEAAHLMENHATGREINTPLDDHGNHGPGFQGHLVKLLNHLSPPSKDFPGAGDDFPEHVAYHSGKMAAKDPDALRFKLWQSPKTKQHPDKLGTHVLTAVHPKKGPVGTLQYIKRADHLQVETLRVPGEHRGNGFAGHLMDEMQRRHPGTPINHGSRTDDGQDWWDKYSEGKDVTDGRTMASKTASGNWIPPKLTDEHEKALSHPDYGQSKRDLLSLAKSPKPGLKMWRGEVRHKDHLADPPSVGMHWSINPDQVISPNEVPKDHHRVIWEATLHHPEKESIPRSHPIWHGKHMSMDSEAEIRLRPHENDVHVTRRYVHDNSDDNSAAPVVRKPERSSPGWTAHEMDHHVPVQHARSQDDGLMGYHKAYPDLFATKPKSEQPEGEPLYYGSTHPRGSGKLVAPDHFDGETHVKTSTDWEEAYGHAQDKVLDSFGHGKGPEDHLDPDDIRVYRVTHRDKTGADPIHASPTERHHPMVHIEHEANDGPTHHIGRRVASGHPFIHVSPREFRPGDKIEPADDHGGQSTFDYSDLDKVYLSHPDHAEYWGNTVGAAGGHKEVHHYEVEPHDHPEFQITSDNEEEYTSSGATVKRKLRTQKVDSRAYTREQIHPSLRVPEGREDSYERTHDREEHQYAQRVPSWERKASRDEDFMKGVTFTHEPVPRWGYSGILAEHPQMKRNNRSDHYAGHIFWQHDSGEVTAIEVNEACQRKGVASELWNRAKEITPHLKHSDNQTDDGKAWASTTAAKEPNQRLFGKTFGLDHRLFEGEHLKDDVRRYILETLGGFWGPVFGPGWERWAKVYFAGSEASEWTSKSLEGNGDFDVLIGVDYDEIRRQVPVFDRIESSDEQITDALNRSLRKLDEKTENAMIMVDGEMTGPWNQTWYVNKDSLDIRKIKPYAAYNVTDDEWAVRPPHLPDWDISQFPEGHPLVQEAHAVASYVRAVLALPEPYRSQQATALWTHLHTDRGRAFGPQGEGWWDSGNVIEKYLDQLGLWEKLVRARMDARDHPEMLNTPKDWSNDPRLVKERHASSRPSPSVGTSPGK